MKRIWIHICYFVLVVIVTDSATSARIHESPKKVQRHANGNQPSWFRIEEAVNSHIFEKLLSQVKEPTSKDNAMNAEQKITDGMPAPDSMWPWSVALETENAVFVCGAVLIDPLWVLTAGHCGLFGEAAKEAGEHIFARIGANNLTIADETDRVIIDQIHVHPQMADLQDTKYDIAMMKLKRQALVNRTTDIIVMPKFTHNNFTKTVACFIIGWGSTDGSSQDLSPVLQQRWVNVITNHECQVRWDESFTKPTIYSTQICIGAGATGDVSACSGDSGSPLQCWSEEQQEWVLAGVSSWGSGACNTYPSVYSRVSVFLPWINHTMASLDQTPPDAIPDPGH